MNLSTAIFGIIILVIPMAIGIIYFEANPAAAVSFITMAALTIVAIVATYRKNRITE
jgi:hypothetical protein